MAVPDHLEAQRLDQRGLARPRRPADADPDGSAGVGEELVEQGLRLAAVVVAGGLHEGDGAGQRPAVALADALGQPLGAGAAHARSDSRSMTRFAAWGML